MNTDQTPTSTAPPVSPRHCYAVTWPCGVAVNANTGRPMRRVVRFTDPAARDEWVYQGKPYRTSAGYRESVSRKEVEPEIRRSRTAFPFRDSPVWEEDQETGIEWLS